MATEKRLIDANEMKNNVREAMMRQFKKNGNRTALLIAEIMWHFIHVADTVDAVEVVHGRWIIEDADSGQHGCYEAYMIVECSHCGQSHEVETGQFGWAYGDPFPFNYCPNCGAKMDGDVNG